MAQGYTDNYASTLSSGYTSGAGSLVVASVSGLPTTGLTFYVSVASEGANTTELFKCTSYTGTTLAVVGAQGNTSASNHASGATITGCWILSDVLDGIRLDQSKYDTYANLPASGMKKGDRFSASDCPYEFIYDGSVWKAKGCGFPVVVPPTAGWSWVNQGGASIDALGLAHQTLTVPSSSGSSNLRIRVRTLPATPYTVTALFSAQFAVATPQRCGMILRNSGAGTLVTLDLTNSTQLMSLKWTSATAFSAYYIGSASVTGIWVFTPNLVWLRYSDDGVNRVASISVDGMNWQQVHTIGHTDFLTADQIGWYGNSESANGFLLSLISWSGA